MNKKDCIWEVTCSKRRRKNILMTWLYSLFNIFQTPQIRKFSMITKKILCYGSSTFLKGSIVNREIIDRWAKLVTKSYILGRSAHKMCYNQSWKIELRKFEATQYKSDPLLIKENCSTVELYLLSYQAATWQTIN